MPKFPSKKEHILAERDRELVAKRESDPQKWTFAALAQFYNLTRNGAHFIYHRTKNGTAETEKEDRS